LNQNSFHIGASPKNLKVMLMKFFRRYGMWKCLGKGCFQ
jgi:hypothetical protein